MRNSRISKPGVQDRVTAAEVAQFLRQNPEFFKDHLDLLEILEVPHPSGAAVSLVARQLDLLREKNRRLQHQLDEILRVARDNDALHRRIQQLTLTLLNATGLEDALASLEWGLHQYFQTDFVVLRIVAPVFDTPIRGLRMPADSKGGKLFAALLDSGKPLCGKPVPEQVAFLFGDNAADVASQALIPLQHAGLRGLLAIGSRTRGHFQPGMGALFLTQLGEILSARLATLLHGRI